MTVMVRCSNDARRPLRWPIDKQKGRVAPLLFVMPDFSISRLKEKMPWGIPVPGDDKHVMYVWFDALINYISAIGWPEDMKKFNKWWPVVQLAGKDNTRQQSAMWQAMLMSAGIEPSRQIFIHGFIHVGGEKISKSAGNTVDPFYYVKKYGVDAVRYYLIRHISPFEDSDFSEESLEEAYNANLANGLGNFTSRVLTLGETLGKIEGLKVSKEVERKIEETKEEIEKELSLYRLHEAAAKIWQLIGYGDAYVNKNKPWETKDKQVVFDLIVLLDNIAFLTSPIIPESAEKITKSIVWDGDTLSVKKSGQLFPRLS